MPWLPTAPGMGSGLSPNGTYLSNRPKIVGWILALVTLCGVGGGSPARRACFPRLPRPAGRRPNSLRFAAVRQRPTTSPGFPSSARGARLPPDCPHPPRTTLRNKETGRPHGLSLWWWVSSPQALLMQKSGVSGGGEAPRARRDAGAPSRETRLRLSEPGGCRATGPTVRVPRPPRWGFSVTGTPPGASRAKPKQPPTHPTGLRTKTLSKCHSS